MSVIGYYGCYCHPFEDWDDHDKYNKQQIEIGAKYKIRHTGKECIIRELDAEYPGFVKIFVEPYDCARCNKTEHKSNLIKL